MSQLFEIGEIVKPRGLKGEVRLNSFLMEPRNILPKVDVIFLQRKDIRKGPFRISGWNANGNNIVLEIEGIDAVEKAQALVGFRVLISTDKLDALPEDEYYWHELIGMTVVTEEGEKMGAVSSIFSTGSNDVYVCTGDKGEMLIPAIADVVVGIDRISRHITIRLLPGMDKPC